jgi:hypothetical protein
MGGTEENVQEETGTSTGFTETFGTKAVGIKFNPSKNPTVDVVKIRFADVIDVMNELRASTQDPEVKRLCSVAITEAQTAQMWAVKALTWS